MLYTGLLLCAIGCRTDFLWLLCKILLSFSGSFLLPPGLHTSQSRSSLWLRPQRDLYFELSQMVSLPSQGARVGVGVGGVYTAEAPGFPTLLKTWQCSAAGSSPPVHWGQLSSHKDVSQVGWSQVRHHGSSCHPLLHTGVPLHQKVVVLVHDAGGVRQSSVEGERQDDWSLLLWPHHFLHHLLPRPQEH